MEAGVACGNARERSNDGSPTLAPSSSRPTPPVTALKRPANHHATETAGGEITRLRTKSSRSTAQEGRPTHTHLASPPSQRRGGKVSGVLREGFGVPEEAREAGGRWRLEGVRASLGGEKEVWATALCSRLDGASWLGPTRQWKV